MDSPMCEGCTPRSHTPVCCLDDHRFQPSSLPRADTVNNAIRGIGLRRGTLDSQISIERPHPSREGQSSDEAPQIRGGTRSRDFIQEKADHGSRASSLVGSVKGIDVDGSTEVETSSHPPPVRRTTLRRLQPLEKPGVSRASSKSSRSTSPPNSVDAFADPRRRERTNTIGSKTSSEFESGVQRTVSGGTHSRRPTFSDGKVTVPEIAIHAGSKRDSAEEDVCFPPPLEVTCETHTIDFEELEEFVADSRRERAQKLAERPEGHGVSSEKPASRVFTDLRRSPQGVHGPLPISDQYSLDQCMPNTDDVEKHAVADLEDVAYSLKRSPSTLKANVIEPTRFSFFSSELDLTIHAAEIKDLVMPGESFRDLFELSPEGGVWWLDVVNPTEEEVNVLSKAFSIHPLTSEDIKTQETREKVELFKQYYFVCFRSFFQMDKKSEDYMDAVNVYLVVFREGVLSFTFRQSPHAANVRRRIGRLRDYVALSSDWVCYALIDDIVDTFGPVIHEVEQETDMIEDQVFVTRDDDSNSLLRQIGDCRRKVMGLMRLLGGKADVIKGFAKRCNEQYSVTPRAEIGLYLGDIQDHVVTMMSNLAHFEKMLSRSHSNYLAQLSMEGIAQGNRTNRVLSKITIIATILVPLNLICGLFGMNVPVPGRSTTGLQWFFGILGIIGAIIVTSLMVAKRHKFI